MMEVPDHDSTGLGMSLAFWGKRVKMGTGEQM